MRVADTRAAPPLRQALAAALPAVPLVAGAFDAATFAGADLIAISPGVPTGASGDRRAAVARGVDLVGDIELFARALPPTQKLLAVTGSNGKTTVTALAGALCAAAGLDDHRRRQHRHAGARRSCRPDGRWPDVYVLELSSFQLETTSSLRPLAATVLNVTEQPPRPLPRHRRLRGGEGAHLRATAACRC